MSVKEPVLLFTTAPPLSVVTVNVPLLATAPPLTVVAAALATEAKDNVPPLCVVNAVDPAPDNLREPPPNAPTALVVAPLNVIDPPEIVARYAEPATTTVPLLMVDTSATPEKFVTPDPPVMDVIVEEPLAAKKLRLPPLLTMASSVFALVTLTVAPEERVKSLVSPK